MSASFYDQLGRNIEIRSYPQRIISLVPSQTELLYDLGLDEAVTGITKFCIHPEEWFRSKTRVGGTKQLHIEIIRRLQPDLIIGNKEENERSQLETLMQEFPVWISDVNNLQDALNMIESVGEITGRKEKALAITKEIHRKFYHKNQAAGYLRDSEIKTAYFIWHDPWMVAGGDTFIQDMLHHCGLQNCFAQISRYPDISLELLKKKNCGLILLSSEPFPFKEKHAEEIRRVLPGVKIHFVDGEMFSWYGSRLLQAPDYFEKVMTAIRGTDLHHFS